MTEITELRYTDAEDKCFGVAGMAIAMVIFNAEDRFDGVNIDKTDLDAVEFTPDFCFPHNPSLSPKNVWNHKIEQFRLSSALILANVLSRKMIRRHSIPESSVVQAILSSLMRAGEDSLQLESDEVRMIFEKNYHYLDRAFRSQAISLVASEIAKTLRKRHTLSRSEIIETLSRFT